MRIGLLLQVERGDAGVAEVYERVLQHVCVAEDNGFDMVWIPEAHAAQSVPLPAPLVLGSAIAAQTNSIRIGALVKLALHHPVAVCEAAAVLDQISNGRLVFGADPGVQEREFAGARVRWTARAAGFREALDIVLHGWTEDGFAYLGELNRLPLRTRAPVGTMPLQVEPCVAPYRRPTERADLPFDYLSILPKPVQVPRPPVYLVAADADTVGFAARNGHALLVPAQPAALAVAAAQNYWQALGAAGRQRHEVDLALACDVHVDPDGELARQRVPRPPPGSLIGSPEEVLEAVKVLQRDTGCRQLLCRVQLSGLAPEQVDASIALLAAEVRSRLQM